ncbi:MAG: hypothetical protein OXQ29_04470 [Rhodospirillaceae bacterium]|nr:hypothetical protein [Rhodospirillaceae bacterium]
MQPRIHPQCPGTRCIRRGGIFSLPWSTFIGFSLECINSQATAAVFFDLHHGQICHFTIQQGSRQYRLPDRRTNVDFVPVECVTGGLRGGGPLFHELGGSDSLTGIYLSARENYRDGGNDNRHHDRQPDESP